MKKLALTLALTALALPAMAEHHGDAKHDDAKHESGKHEADAKHDTKAAAPVSGTEVSHEGHDAAQEGKSH
jgi:Ni/Co efflux regulator RcnB